MPSKGSNVDGGNRNKTLAIVAVVIFAAAGAWLYFGRGQNLEDTIKTQVAQQAAEHPAPPPAPAEESVATPEENKPEATADSGETTESETTPDGTPAKKKPLQAKAGRSIK